MDRLLTAFDAYVAALVAAAPQGMADARTAAQHAFEAEAETARADVAIWTSPDGSHWQRVPHDAGFVAGDVEGMQYGAFSLAVSGDSIVIVGRTTGPQTTIWLDK